MAHLSNAVRGLIFVVFACTLFCARADRPLDVVAQPGQAANALTTSRVYSPQAPGPYAVGRTTLNYIDTDREDRPVVIDVWYPIQPDDALEPSSYDLVFAQLPSPVAKAGGTVAAGSFPLLVFSHGSQGIRFQSFFLTEALASHGFVVAAPDHAGNTAADLVFNTTLPFEQIVLERPQDVIFTIDRMLANSDDPASEFHNAVDGARIGVLGHSFGGYTTLAAASGIDGVVAADPRIDALAPFAPASAILTDAQLTVISQPTLILGGTADTTTPIENQSTRPFELMIDSERTRVDILDAGHQSFTNICTFNDTLLDAGIPGDLIDFLLGSADEGCAPDLIPIEQAQSLTRLYMVSFFRRYLNNQLGYDTFLGADFADAKNLPVTVFNAGP